MIGGWLVSPERPHGMATFAPFSVAVMPVIVEPAMLSLNTKRELPPAPVSTNLFPAFSTTSKLTVVAVACVSVTVPNCVAVPQPPERWHDVRLNVSAWLTLGNAALAASNAALTHPLRRNEDVMAHSLSQFEDKKRARPNVELVNVCFLDSRDFGCYFFGRMLRCDLRVNEYTA